MALADVSANALNPSLIGTSTPAGFAGGAAFTADAPNRPGPLGHLIYTIKPSLAAVVLSSAAAIPLLLLPALGLIAKMDIFFSWYFYPLWGISAPALLVLATYIYARLKVIHLFDRGIYFTCGSIGSTVGYHELSDVQLYSDSSSHELRFALPDGQTIRLIGHGDHESVDHCSLGQLERICAGYHQCKARHLTQELEAGRTVECGEGVRLTPMGVEVQGRIFEWASIVRIDSSSPGVVQVFAQGHTLPVANILVSGIAAKPIVPVIEEFYGRARAAAAAAAATVAAVEAAAEAAAKQAVAAVLTPAA
jgi:hypothetical protein